MKIKLIKTAAVLSAAILSFTAPSVFAGKGSHGGGGFSGISGGGHGRGNAGSSSHGFSGYSKGISNHGYSGGLKGYTGGGLGRVYSGYGQKSYSHQGSYSNRVYGSHPGNRTVTSGKQFYSSQKSYGKSFNRNQSAVNRTNRITSANQHSAYGNRAAQRGLREGLVSKQAPTVHDGKASQGNWAKNNPRNRDHFNQQTQNKLRNWQGNKSSWAEAKQRHRDNHGDHNGHHDGHHDHAGHNHHHNHDWWNHHCSAVVWVDWGWWGWWDGWWYPAWGYDPYYRYSYDEPIYGYGGLAPDEIVSNVQSELQRLGYFSYAVDGVMGPLTREALMRYQRDQGLPITGAVDADTVGSLGLSS